MPVSLLIGLHKILLANRSSDNIDHNGHEICYCCDFFALVVTFVVILQYQSNSLIKTKL